MTEFCHCELSVFYLFEMPYLIIQFHDKNAQNSFRSKTLKIIITLLTLWLSPLAFADSNTDMMFYVQHDYQDDLAQLLSHPDKAFNINYQDADGNTALIWAINNKTTAILDLLLNAYPYSTGIKYNLTNKEGVTALYYSVYKKCELCVTKLLKQGDSRIDIEAGPVTPLVRAVIDDNDSIAADLIKVKANTEALINYGDNKSRSVLYALVSKIMPLALAEILKTNIDVNFRFENKKTPLMIASLKGEIQIVKKLIDHGGVLLNLRDEDGNTALHYSAKGFGFYGLDGITPVDASVYEYLLKMGAKPDLQNLAGNTPEQILSSKKLYFENKNALVAKLINLVKVNPTQYSFKVNQVGYIHGVEFYRNSKSLYIYFNKNFKFSLNIDNLTLTFKAEDYNGTLSDDFTFQLSSMDELNQLKEMIDKIKSNTQFL